MVATSRGYGFNKSHTLAYSLIALQEMNLAFKYPIIFWNCACLISDSGGAQMEENYDEEGNVREDDECEASYMIMEDFGAEYIEEDSEEVIFEEDKDIPLDIFYALIIPLLNTFIYSLRNKEVLNVRKIL